MKPQIKTLLPKKLIGKKLSMSLSDNRTPELWKSFMMRQKEIRNMIGSNLYSMQVFDTNYFSDFDPTREFTKWAAIEVSDFNFIPDQMEAITLTGGLYAVFPHLGGPEEGPSLFQYIYGTWLPGFSYELDARPHFEILGEKYKNGDADSEEEIWIPVKVKE